MKSIAIIGFGRFGQLLAELTKNEFEIYIIDSDPERQKLAKTLGYKVINISSIAHAEHIFLAVPISTLEEVIKQIAPLLNVNHVVSDICSVKVYPANLMKKYLPNCQTIASHPLFGPYSAKRGLKGLKIALCRLNVSDENYQIWKDFWIRKEIEVLESTPEEHDQDIIYSLALTHSLARIFIGMEVPNLRFITRSFNDMKEIAELSVKDTDKLFHDMLYYNPYLSDMKTSLEKSFTTVLERIKAIDSEPKIDQQ